MNNQQFCSESSHKCGVTTDNFRKKFDPQKLGFVLNSIDLISFDQNFCNKISLFGIDGVLTILLFQKHKVPNFNSGKQNSFRKY